jgi:hypothetical protein
MNERSHNFNDADDESEITLATPRFDETEASRAHAVVPLDAVRRSHTAVGKAHATFRRGGRRSWPLSVIAVALLAVVTVGGIATTVLRRANKARPAAASSVVAPDVLQTNAVQPPAATESRDEARVSRAPRRVRDAVEPRSDGDDESFPATEILRRVEREGSGGEDEDRRDEDKGRGKHRKHDGDEGSDSRKDSKRAKKGSARLVDVLTGPR